RDRKLDFCWSFGGRGCAKTSANAAGRSISRSFFTGGSSASEQRFDFPKFLAKSGLSSRTRVHVPRSKLTAWKISALMTASRTEPVHSFPVAEPASSGSNIVPDRDNLEPIGQNSISRVSGRRHEKSR